jgi:hypothetical protein
MVTQPREDANPSRSRVTVQGPTVMLYVFKSGDQVQIVWNATAPKRAERRRSGLIAAIKTYCAG